MSQTNTTKTTVEKIARTDVSYNGNTVHAPAFVGTSESVKVVKMPGAKTLNAAWNMAKNYLRIYGTDLSSTELNDFVIKALDIHYFGDSTKPKLKLKDRIRVTSIEHGINNVYICKAMEINITDMSENSYTVGKYRPPRCSEDKVMTRVLGYGE